MATLVQFLVAGVRGAESGTATFVLRGTASSALSVMYSDFEATAQPASNVIDLDSNGAAEVYVEAYVDVTIRSSAGDILRTVTVGNSAPLVEVQSTSFKGTDYDGSPANTVGEPITLKALLDKWILSAGAPDWQVLVDGVATDLDAAVAGFTGLFINVKDPTYGAAGDGVTDDTTAIAAATVAAAGGVVIFPPGTYKVTALSISTANVNWWGSGAGSTIISGTTSTAVLSLTNNTNTAWKNFRDMSFTSSGTYDRLVLLEESQNVSFRNCAFDASNCTADAIACTSSAGLSKYFFTDCDFTLGASTPRGLYNQAAISARSFSLKGCNLKVPSGFTGSMLVGADFNVEGSRFDASAVTSGVYRAVDAESQTVTGRYVGNFTGNKFLDGASGGFAFKLTGLGTSCNFSEDGNTFIGFDTPDATAEKGQTYEITDADSTVPGNLHLGSRKGRTIHVTISGEDFTASMCLEAEHLVISSTSVSGPVIITVPALIPGLEGRIVLENNSGGGAINFRFEDSVGDGPAIDLNNAGEVAMTLGGGDGFLGSAHYLTTALPDGTFRSLITTEIEHT